MAAFFIYMLKSSLCLALLFLCYRLLLSRETFHRFNRLALLSLPLISALLPLVELPVHEVPVQGFALPMVEEAVMPPLPVFRPEEAETEAAAAFPWCEFLLLAYLAGVAALLLRLLWAHLRLWQLIRRCTPLRTEADGIRILTHRDAGLAPFSWYRYIVLSEADLQHGARAFLTHERAHIRARHSLDRLVAHVLAAFHWFNPAAWLLLRELKQIHEYEADRRVLSEGIDARSYQFLLIKKAVGTRLYSMANSLNDSSLNKRIIMMKKKNSSPWARAKYLYVLPLAAVSVTALARTEVSNLESELSACNVSRLFAFAKAGDGKSVESQPIEPQKAPLAEADEENVDTLYGTVAFMTTVKKGDAEEYEGLLYSNVGGPYLDYLPKGCEVSKRLDNPMILIDGKEGSKKEYDELYPLRIKSARVLMDAAQLAPYGEKGKDGVMLVTTQAKKNAKIVSVTGTARPAFPATLDKDSGEGVKGFLSTLKEEPSMLFSSDDGNTIKYLKNPLILIDGKEATQEDYDELHQLHYKQVKSVTVLQEANQIAPYGEKGKNGVVLVSSKRSVKPAPTKRPPLGTRLR